MEVWVELSSALLLLLGLSALVGGIAMWYHFGSPGWGLFLILFGARAVWGIVGGIAVWDILSLVNRRGPFLASHLWDLVLDLLTLVGLAYGSWLLRGDLRRGLQLGLRSAR